MPSTLDLLAGYLGRQRWFAGKGRAWRLARTQTLGWLPAQGPDQPRVEILVATVAYADGDTEAYQLPLVHYPGPMEQLTHALVGELTVRDGGAGGRESGERADDDDRAPRTWAYDALHVKDVTGRWLQGVADEGRLVGPDGRSDGAGSDSADSDGAGSGETDSDGAPDRDGGPGSDAPVSSTDVSGTDTASGGGWVQFRRVPGTPGVPLDAPSLVITAEQSNTSLAYGDTAILKVFRKLTAGINPDVEVHTALARVGCEHIATPYGWADGAWQGPDGPLEGSLVILQQFLRNGTDGWLLARTSVRDLLAERDLHADEVGGDFAAEAHRLGLTTADVHADLARALPSGVLDQERLARTAAGMRARLGRAITDVAALAPYADGLRATYDALAALDATDAPVPVQRLHGDYHLGQVMRTPDGWKVLDFEGEPGTPLPQRRALDCPLRDVAGMLRSFDYAARHMLADGPWDAQREYRAAEWAQRNREAFCDGYAKGGGTDPQAHDVLLRAYETDKAVYEAVYEARNRPGWLRVPLAAIERLSERAAGG